MKPTIALNIFTNCTQSAPDTTIIKKTFDSFIDTFGELETTVYCDSHPNVKVFDKYVDNICDFVDMIVETESLSEGYIYSIKNSHTDYLFQLEGDWTFIKNNIEHTLDEILECMFAKNIYHFRFNKRANQIAVWDKKMEPRVYAGENFNLQYCESNNMSNNPHIIDVKKYREEIAKHIKIKPGSKGIEEELNAQNKYISCIYGGVGYPATVAHLDGRRAR